MVQMGYKLVGLCFLTQLCLVSAAVNCSSELVPGVKACFRNNGLTVLSELFPYFQDSALLQTLCNVTSTVLCCLEEAIGDCSSQEQYIFYNVKSYQAIFNGFCSDQTATMAAYDNCLQSLLALSASCFTTLHTSMTAALNTFDQTGDSAQLATDLCSADLAMAACLAVTSSGDCTQTNVDLLNVTYHTLYSPPRCGLTTEWDTLFSGDLGCEGDTGGGDDGGNDNGASCTTSRSYLLAGFVCLLFLHFLNAGWF